MTDIPLPAQGSNSWITWAQEQEAASDSVRATIARPTITPETYGAVGDGVADDAAALASALAALQPGYALELTGTYRHSTRLWVETNNVVIRGGGTLIATNEQLSSFTVSADDVTIEDITLRIVGVTQRWDPYAMQRLRVGDFDNADLPAARTTIRRVLIDGSAATGVFIGNGSHDFHLEDVTVVDSMADGIHMTGGAHHGRVVRPTIVRPGDDGVAVVSYLDSAVCHHIEVLNPVIRNQPYGRGVSVVGGEDITYYAVDVARSDAAGIYIAAETGTYNTHGVRRVKILGGRLSGTCMQGSDHGAVTITSMGSAIISDVEVSGLHISDHYGRWTLLRADNVGTNVVFRDILAVGKRPRSAFEGDSDVTRTNVLMGAGSFTTHPSETWFTYPTMPASRGTTATLLNGTTWIKTGDADGDWRSVGFPPYTTAARPSASVVKAGFAYFDTTLNKPAWSDGTNYRDATGATV